MKCSRSFVTHLLYVLGSAHVVLTQRVNVVQDVNRISLAIIGLALRHLSPAYWAVRVAGFLVALLSVARACLRTFVCLLRLDIRNVLVNKLQTFP